MFPLCYIMLIIIKQDFGYTKFNFDISKVCLILSGICSSTIFLKKLIFMAKAKC